MKFFDTHAHYNDEKFDLDRGDVIKSVYEACVTKLVNAGYSLGSSKKAIEIAKDYEWMYVICGISPNDIPEDKEKFEEEWKLLKELVIENRFVKNVENAKGNLSLAGNSTKKIVGIGEIGLDYYWNKDNKELQKYCFIKQIELANEMKLPIVIHTRDAIDDTIDILRNKMNAVRKGIFHCCPLNRELVKQALNLGFHISFAGPVTFKNSKNADEIIKMVPLDRILIETDSPYLAPEPNRGKRNDSRNVRYIAEKIANVKGISAEEVADVTYKNAETIFDI